MAHDNRDMPVWGAAFRLLLGGGAGADARVEAVVRFLQEIRERPAE